MYQHKERHRHCEMKRKIKRASPKFSTPRPSPSHWKNVADEKRGQNSPEMTLLHIESKIATKHINVQRR